MLRYSPTVSIVTRVRQLLVQDHNKIITRSLQRWGAVLLKDKGTLAPSEQTTANFEAIKRRGFYIDEVYQHVKHTGVRDLSLVDDGKNIQVTWEDQHISRFHAMWLRHNCQCETCLPQTSTVLVDFSKIDDDIRVTSARMEGEDVLNLTWTGQAEETHHEGFILTKFLRHYCYSEAAERKRRTERAMKFDNERVIPEVEFDDVMKNEEGLYKWLTALSDRGLCLVKSVPTVRGTIRQVAERIAPIQHTIYGDIFEVKSVAEPLNGAYTGMELGLHMDQVHYESPPGLQLLHCIEFDKHVEGGENTFIDLHQVAHKLRDESPDLFHTLAQIPSCAHTVAYNREFPAHVCIQRPLIALNHKDEIVSVYWHPMLVGPLQVSEEFIEPFYKAYKKLYTMVHCSHSLFKHKLQPGDMITFNNRRVLHGRAAFTDNGKRLLQGCYINISEFQSKVQIFHNKYGGGRLATRCGSNDWL